jgi:hypothetical protein
VALLGKVLTAPEMEFGNGPDRMWQVSAVSLEVARTEARRKDELLQVENHVILR